MTVFLVTGAGRGLGYALIKALVKTPGATVLGLARNKAAVEAKMKSDAFDAFILEADITDQNSLISAAKIAENFLHGKGIDVIINNAAYFSETTGLKTLEYCEINAQVVIDDIHESINVNVLGACRTISAFLPLVKRSELKKVISISSGMGDIDFINETQLPIAAPYAVSKAALGTLTAKFAAAYADQGILFASICPGRFDKAESGATRKLGHVMYQRSKDNSVVLASSSNMALMEKYGSKFEQYAPGFRPMPVDEAAIHVLAAIERSSLAGGYSGSFLSFNGTKRWM